MVKKEKKKIISSIFFINKLIINTYLEKKISVSIMEKVPSRVSGKKCN